MATTHRERELLDRLKSILSKLRKGQSVEIRKRDGTRYTVKTKSSIDDDRKTP